MDRNCVIEVTQELVAVALLAEGVDRNALVLRLSLLARLVALLAEGVDRNLVGDIDFFSCHCRPPRGGRG